MDRSELISKRDDLGEAEVQLARTTDETHSLNIGFTKYSITRR
jgi:hypothetical protein